MNTRIIPGLLMVFGFASCSEEFPSYRQPGKVLVSELQVVAPDTVEMYLDPLSGEYFLNSVLSLKILVTNIHDDLLQGRAMVGGRIVLQSFAQIPRTLVVPLTQGDLRSPPTFQGNLALTPRSSAEFLVLWIPYASDGNIVFAGLPFVPTLQGKVYGPITFIGYAEAQLFEHVQPVSSARYEFTLVFRTQG